ncbi:hypothetical protein [Psychrobacter sp. ASPA161_6]|uniref:hypothetical protein n=1 Tax=Psychrobacter sp. ASPA161_6 TaxID=3160962 RepID=UPI003F7DEBAE
MKVLQRIKNDKAHAIARGWSVKLLSTVVVGCMATSAGHTSDREIYQAASNGNASIMMMLDNSISMNNNSIVEDYPNIRFRYSGSDEIRERFFNDDGMDIGYIPYTVEYYRPSSNGDKYYSRISRLKMALIPMFADPKTGFGEEVALTKYKIGLGSFFGGSRGGGGQIDAPIADLTQENRISLIYKIAGLQPSTYTPIANAYAEAGAYMLGTKTKTSNSSYSSPMPTPVPNKTNNQCDGYGVYFLTDGEPNSVYSKADTRSLMNTSLEGGVTIGNSCESTVIPPITSDGTAFETGRNSTTYGKPAWECIGEYAQALYSKDNAKKDSIATATVGFGNVYKELKEKGKTSKVITRPGKPPETVDVYQCDASGIGQDAKNLCKLGEKGQGYGEGGFYYTDSSTDIADSVKSFIEEVGSTEIESISTGTMSVPLDSLGGLKSRKFAYLPILDPVPGSPKLWNGNLKKYNVVNGTLKGDDNNFVFADSTGLFAKNTHDIWNTIGIERPDTTRPDGGLPQVGGAYQQIFENANAPILGDRNLFVDTGNSLTNLKVTNKKPENFVSLTNGTENNNAKKLALLKFMGYSVTDTVTDGTELSEPQNKDLKNIGGVLHSTPQLITQSVAVDASGQFDTSKRKDYIIYGSMDGALHMLDDSTGQETFTFVPKQILDLQPDALAGNGNGTAVNGSYPYGVDAPWLTYVAYTTKSKIDEEEKTTINTYEAAQSFALGGLRMGGSMYYALDVTKVNEPKMIYSVGSNYANRRKSATTVALSGTKNGTTNNTTPEQQAYARMGQTWGKPTLGYVKSGGERVMVSFLPGGYDDCYEDPQFKLGNNASSESCADKSKAQGNAMYMVQMGKVEDATDDNDGTPVFNGEETVDTSDGNGDLLWWASNQGSSANNTSRSTSLQYSRDDDLKHSIVTQVRAIDRNYDGLTDHIYFADLGGQVWRADINNNADTDTFKVDRVVKVLDVSDQATGTTDTDAPPRIYERPLITFYNGKYDYNNAADEKGTYSGVQAMITVGTGDRSSPVSAERNKPDALYTVIDKDVSRRDLFDYDSDAASTISLRTPVIKVSIPTDKKSNKLQQLMFTDADRGNTGIRQNMINNEVQGWYMPFTYWDDGEVSTSKYKLKMFNEPDAIAGVLISSTYNPDEGQDIQACSAGVKGLTQRERTCLPYGSCSEDVDTSRSTFVAGSGIVDNIISQYNDTAVFSSLVNRCEGDDCKPDLICPSGDCNDNKNKDGSNKFIECVGPSCGVGSGINTDKRINPLSWLEH